MNKIIKISLWVLTLTALAVSLAFVGEARRSQACSGINITIDSVGNHEFITEEDVLAIINDQFDSLINRPLAIIDINQIELVLNNNPYVKKADVYETINGKIGITIIQRMPVVRVIGYGAESFYYDVDGKKMPLSNKYCARVPLVLCDSMWKNAKAPNCIKLGAKDTLEKANVMAQLYVLTNFIKSDTLLNAIVDHVYLQSDSEFAIIPRLSNHIIEFGDISDYEEKLDKLILFYQKGLNAVGWDTYSSINLKYKNQVVCKQKNPVTVKPKVVEADSTKETQIVTP